MKTAQRHKVKRKTNPRGEGGRLREEAIDAAMRILDREPATKLSLRMVAKEAGVAAPSLYRQFADVDAMLKEIVRECWRQVGETMCEAQEVAGDLPPLDRLNAQLTAYLHYAMARPSRYQLLFALSVNWDAELDGPLRPAYRPILETILIHQEEGGWTPTGDAAAAALMTLSLIHGRIAFAHLAPARAGNGVGALEAFVNTSLACLFSSANQDT